MVGWRDALCAMIRCPQTGQGVGIDADKPECSTISQRTNENLALLGFGRVVACVDVGMSEDSSASG